MISSSPLQALGLGAALGAGLWLTVRALIGRGPALAEVLAGVDRATAPLPADRTLEHRVGKPLVAMFGTERQRRDLRITGRAPERQAFEKLAAALAGAVLPLALGLLMVSNGVALPSGAVVVAAVALGLGGFVLPDAILRTAARARRGAFAAALSCYLDLVNVVLAGGAGTETALEAAAEAGDGWAFVELRNALSRSRALRRSPWDCFAELGDDLGVSELQELAASVRLAGQQGARVRASLTAKAASLRGHQLARLEASAQSASERMALPTVLLFTGFLLFIGYPAVAEILGTGSW